MKFEVLKELVATITKNKVKRIEIIGNEDASDTLVKRLYQGIQDGSITSDEDAARYLYNTSNAKDHRYKKTRHQIVRRLLHTALFIDIDTPRFTDRQKAYCQCHADYAAAVMLIFRNARASANWFLQQTLSVALHYEFLDLSVNITKMLWNTYKVTNIKKYKHYFNLNQKLVGMQRREEEVMAGHNEVILKYIPTLSPNRDVHELAQQYLNKLLPLRAMENTVQFEYYLSQIEILHALSINDTKSTLAICARILSFMDTNVNANQTAKALLAIQKLVCQTSLRMFDQTEGFQSYAYCLQILEDGSINWFKISEYYFHHCVHARRYTEAWQVFKTGYLHPNYEKLQGSTRDNWHLYGGYCHLLAQIGKMDLQEVTKTIGPFKYRRFINDFDTFDQDKTAMNIPLIILPLVYSIVTGTYQEQYFSIESLEKYQKRHLTRELNLRSILFFKLLILLLSNPFEHKDTSKKLKMYLEQLKAMPIQVSRQTVAIEIIPYEDLWEMITRI